MLHVASMLLAGCWTGLKASEKYEKIFAVQARRKLKGQIDSSCFGSNRIVAQSHGK